MTSTALIGATWLAALLVLCVLPVRTARPALTGIAFVASYAVAFVLMFWQSLGSSATALLIAVAVTWELLEGERDTRAAVWSGAVAACATAMSASTTAGLLASAALAIGTALFAWRFVQRESVVHKHLRAQALAAFAFLTPVLAALPTIQEGWRSAFALSRAPLATGSTAMPNWAWVGALVALAVGVGHGLWRRR